MLYQSAATFRAAEKIETLPRPAAADLGGAGMLAATLIETAEGWLPAGELSRGSRVQTYDGGLKQVTSVERRYFWPGPGRALVHVPGGALDNCEDLWFMPDQRLLISGPLIEQALDALAALVPAEALVGYQGITVRPLDQMVEMIALGFDQEEAVFANSGTLVHCAARRRPAAGSFFPELSSVETWALLHPDQTAAAPLRRAA